MFGILTIQQPEELALSRRAALRFRPNTGVQYGDGLFRMAMYCCAQVTLPESWSDRLREKRVERALRCLRTKGVQEAVLPTEWNEKARQTGIVPVRRRAALEACATQAVSLACERLGLAMGQVGLAVYGRSLSPRAAAQLLTLARSVRTVRVYGEDNEQLRISLWRSCGIAQQGALPEGLPVVGLLLPGGAAQKTPLLTVDLSDGEGSGGGMVWQPQPLPPQGALDRMPPGADAGAFAAVLLQKGAIQAREIRVSRLDIPVSTQYNKEIVENCL